LRQTGDEKEKKNCELRLLIQKIRINPTQSDDSSDYPKKSEIHQITSNAVEFNLPLLKKVGH